MNEQKEETAAAAVATAETVEVFVAATPDLVEANDHESGEALIVKTEQAIVTDQQIDALLEEVQQIKQSSPVKIIEENGKNGPDSADLDTFSNEPLDSLSKANLNGAESEDKNNGPKGNIPKSVSQALFGSGLKVAKVREQQPDLKFIGLKKENVESTKKVKSLQLRLREVNNKIFKLNQEITYLNNLIDTASISSDLTELRKLKSAIQRLEDFLDQKEKEKYEVGMVLTRAMRRRIDSGEGGEFWAN